MKVELPKMMALEMREVGVPKMEVSDVFPIKLSDVFFLDAPKHLERDALAHEMKREVAAHYREVWAMHLHGLGNWAELCIQDPWRNPQKTESSSKDDEDQKRAVGVKVQQKEPPNWYGKGLIVTRAHHEVELAQVEEGFEMPGSVFKAYAFNEHMWEGMLQDEVQFVFRIQLSAKRSDIKQSIDSWFSHFRKKFPPKPVGAPARVDVSRFELAVVRLYRAKLPLNEICARLSGIFPERVGKLSKGEVRKTNMRVKRRIIEARKRFDQFREGYPDDSWALPS